MCRRPCRTIVRTTDDRFLEPEFFQPELAYLPFSIDESLQVVHSTHFANLSYRVQLFFGRLDTLAFIRCAGEPDEATIYLHSLLNHALTPQPVIEGILAHELLHLVVPRAWENGRLRSHPTAFRQREKELIPQLRSMWRWIYLNFYQAMKIDQKMECIWIKLRIAQKIIRSGERCSWEMPWNPCGELDELERKVAEACLI